MKTEHTPEPWRVGRRGNDVVGSNGLGDTVAMMIDCDSDEQTHANARRIVACVNACAGLPTEFVEQFDVAGAFQTVHDLEKQRDELLAALRGLVASCDTGERGPDGRQNGTRMPDRCFVQAGHDAIARVKGGAA